MQPAECQKQRTRSVPSLCSSRHSTALTWPCSRPHQSAPVSSGGALDPHKKEDEDEDTTAMPMLSDWPEPMLTWKTHVSASSVHLYWAMVPLYKPMRTVSVPVLTWKTHVSASSAHLYWAMVPLYKPMRTVSVPGLASRQEQLCTIAAALRIDRTCFPLCSSHMSMLLVATYM